MTEQDQNRGLVNEAIGYEEKDVRFGLVIGSILGLIGLTVVAMVVSLWFLSALVDRRVDAEPTPLPLIDLRPTPPAPRLQPNPIDGTTAEEELANWLAQERRILGSYSWVDEEAGRASIPITRAMDIFVQQTETE